MNISVIGTGYVGLVTGSCLAELGNSVTCIDINESKINSLKEGKVPFFEPGLTDIIKRNTKENRLLFSTDIKQAIEDSEIIFIAVGTPSKENGETDLSSIEQVIKEIGKNMNSYKLIVTKSTVPVGTNRRLKELIKQSQSSPTPVEFDLASNPEFLREGEAVNDFLIPDRIIVGCDSDVAKDIMKNLYKGIARTQSPLIFTSIETAELIKYASNAMLATRISFMNELSRLCEKTNADIKEVAKGIGLDKRIGPRFLQAGIGYGGSCFPKDIKSLIHTGKEFNIDFSILKAVDSVNEEQKKSLFPKIKKLVPDLNGKKIAVWGLAFKPKTDDMREAPSITIINQLQNENAIINAFDPEAEENAKKILKEVNYFNSPLEAAKDCDCLVIVTEWNEFRNLDKIKLKEFLKQPNIVDGRNVYDPEEMNELGFNYIGVGRK